MKLDVHVNGRLVGELEQVDLTRYIFTYASGTPADQAVSLTMPVRAETWAHRFLHPVFQVSLPEGALRQMLHKRYAKHSPYFGDVELLSTVGSHLVGRVKVTAHGSPLAPAAPEESLRQLLSESSQELVDHYLGEHIQYSGVSGGFPKFLAHSPIDGSGNKSTLTFDHWIVKLNDDDHDELVLNEFFGLELARRMGLPTPEYQVSDDASRIAIRRFDFDDKGEHLGFEDMCALMGLNASEKFSGTLERVIKTINAFCSPVNAGRSREQFYSQYLACMAIRNGDAHLKNFGLLYSNLNDARLTPAYDMVSMSVYAPRAQNGDALDTASMSFEGTSKWFTATAAMKFGRLCMLSGAQQKSVGERLVQAMDETYKDIARTAQERPEFRPVGKRMLELWSHGISIHNETLAGDISRAAQHIETDGSTQKSRPRQRY
jgi:serine/threonine-protein kinase HipA